MTEHPITPPPGLVEQWIAQIWHEGTPVKVAASDLHVATQAARWGWEQHRSSTTAMTWQPIDTAPKDGTEILISDYDAIEIVHWVAPQFNLILGVWVNRDNHVMFPCWWQPLPDHPSTEDENTRSEND